VSDCRLTTSEQFSSWQEQVTFR